MGLVKKVKKLLGKPPRDDDDDQGRKGSDEAGRVPEAGSKKSSSRLQKARNFLGGWHPVADQTLPTNDDCASCMAEQASGTACDLQPSSLHQEGHNSRAPPSDAKIPECPREHFTNRTYLCVQMVGVKDIRAADRNGLSDPYCRLRLGGTVRTTKVVRGDLNAFWNEVFMYPAESLAGDSQPVFEVWDSDDYKPDDFLGEAALQLDQAALSTDRACMCSLPLVAERRGKRVCTGLGHVRVALWLEEVAPQLDHLHGASGEGKRETERERRAGEARCPLSIPACVGKRLPMVVHGPEGADAGTLYEEPCMAFISVHIFAVDLATKFQASPSRGRGPPRSGMLRRAVGTVSGRWRALRHTHARSGGDAPRRVRATLRTEDETAQAGLEAPASQPHALTSLDEDDMGEDVSGGLFGGAWHADAEAAEDALQRSGSGSASGVETDEWAGPAEHGAPRGHDASGGPELRGKEAVAESSGHGSDGPEQYLYWQVVLGEQRLCSVVARDHGGHATWGQDLAFVAVLPLRAAALQLTLHRAQARRQPGKPFAHAFIALHDLLGPIPAAGESSAAPHSEAEGSGQWFQLHASGGAERRGGPQEGAVRLRAVAVDADERRRRFQLPFYSELVPPPLLAPSPTLSRPSSAGRCPTSQSQSPPSAVGASPGSRSMPRGDCGEGGGQLPPLAEEGPGPPPHHKRSASGSSFASQLGGGSPQSEGSMSSEAGGGSMEDVAAAAVAADDAQRRPSLNAWLRSCVQPRQAVHSPPPPPEPPGFLRLLVESVELESADTAFCLFKCGPHWGRTASIAGSAHPCFHWEVRVPLYDAYTLLQVGVFREVGKLKIRLSTIAPEEVHLAALPLVADRKSGGKQAATAHLRLQVQFRSRASVAARYLHAPLPVEVYRFGLHQGLVLKSLDAESRRLCLAWLEGTVPPLPRTVAHTLAANERSEFVFSRARANWQRCKQCVRRFEDFLAAVRAVQHWERPLLSLAALPLLVLLAFRPGLVAVGALAVLVAYTVHTRPEKSGRPQPMEPDPEDEQDSDEVESSKSGPYRSLKRKYDRLLRLALNFENFLDDVAGTLERAQAALSWKDPTATGLLVLLAGLLAMAIAVLGLSPVVAALLCWAVRPPFLRKPTPPAPLCFFRRLPSKADQMV